MNYLDIRIQIDRSEVATLTINGRELKVSQAEGPGITQLLGVRSPETENCFGGILASELFSKVGGMMDAAEDCEFFPVWDGCDNDDMLDEIWRKLS